MESASMHNWPGGLQSGLQSGVFTVAKINLWKVVVLAFFVAIGTSVLSTALAQNSFTLQGLSFPCSGCSEQADGLCQIQIDGSPLVTPCDAAVELLLKAELRTTTEDELPSLSQIRDFLLRNEIGKSTAEAAIELLCKRSGGERILEVAGPEILERHSEAFVPLITDNRCGASQVETLWKAVNDTGMALPLRLRVLLITKSPKSDPSAFLPELSVSDIRSDLEKLKTIEESLREFKPEWVSEIELLASRLRACSEIVPTRSIPSACSVQELKQLPPPLARYLQRVQIQQALKVAAESTDPLMALKIVGETNYQEFGTPDTIDAVLQTIRKLSLQESEFGRVRLAIGDHLPLLLGLSKSDRGVGEELAMFFVKLARSAAEDGDVSGSIGFLEKSFQGSANLLETRARLIGTLQSHPQVRRATGLVERIELLQKRNDGKLPSEPEPASNKNLYLLALLLAAIILAVVFRVSRRITVSEFKKQQELLEVEEQGELKELLRSFGLTRMESEAELSKRFRELAKKLHPDAGGNEVEFQKLRERYSRAKKLLQKK